MNSLEDYDFQNVFELIGIESFDIKYLKAKISKLVQEIRANIVSKSSENEMKLANSKQKLESNKNAFIENSKILGKTEEEIKEDVLQYDGKIQRLSDEIIDLRDQKRKMHKKMDAYLNELQNSDNPNTLLYHIIILKHSKIFLANEDINKMSVSDREYTQLVRLLHRNFKSKEDVQQYTENNLIPLEYIDYSKRDMSKFAYHDSRKHHNDLLYAVDVKEMPQIILDCDLETDEKLQVYDIGKFGFGMLINSRTGKPTITYDSYTVVSVLRKKADGEVSIHNGIIYLNEPISNDVEFYSHVVFSEIIMRNAEENNFGFIGNVNKSGKVLEDGSKYRMLTFDGMGNQDLVTALSFAQNHDGNTNLKYCKNLPAVYSYMNGKVMEISGISKTIDSESSQNKGGR